MVGPKVYHIKNTRNYTGCSDPQIKLFHQLNDWFGHNDFNVKKKTEQFSRGSKKGIHVNFVPKFKLHVYNGANGSINVALEYYAKIKIGTAVIVGVLTSGISTVVGVGTLAYTLSEADDFVEGFWRYVDSIFHSSYSIVGLERWKSDGKGGMVLAADPVKYAPPTYNQPPPPVYAQPPPQHYQQQHYAGAPSPYPPAQHYQPHPQPQQPYYAPQQYSPAYPAGQQYAAPQQYPYSTSNNNNNNQAPPPLPPKANQAKKLKESLDLEGPNSPHHPQPIYYPPPTPTSPAPHPPSSTASIVASSPYYSAPPSNPSTVFNLSSGNIPPPQNSGGFNQSGGLYPAIQSPNQHYH
eukprot:TRINITY_DN1592_c0_g1_i2.p1 TRINITY_DN1592_c0_g1~~TRINITY_DN1592_c0_g1_i2.p1  ORF type:complete len:350 (-),score=111.04 TRINITY_DN1592_c0_g1_i2:153-1202(-)